MALNEFFKLKIKLFETAYDGLVKNISSNIFFGISIKLLVIRYTEFAKEYNTEEKEYFEEILAEKTASFNPDIYLKKMEETLLCISFSEKSPLYLTYGKDEICGKYLGLRDGQNTQVKNDKGVFEEQFAHIVFEIAYPSINDKFLVTSYDL